MKISEIEKLLEGRVVCCEHKMDLSFEIACASDLMSDVLTLSHDNVLLITGLNNVSTIRTAEMSDIHCVILARNKTANAEMLALAKELGIVIIECPYSVFRASGVLFQTGIKPIY
ncbi:MAG TPA: hypothetical protein DCM62_11030 [Bacteroidales bacterium]|nr:hypothetical protein [Bacteroidales bacterium]